MQQRKRNEQALKHRESINLAHELLAQSSEPVNKPVGFKCNSKKKPFNEDVPDKVMDCLRRSSSANMQKLISEKKIDHIKEFQTEQIDSFTPRGN